MREDDGVETMSTSDVGSNNACRANRSPDRIPVGAVAMALVLLVAGFTATAFYMPTTPPADILDDIAIYDVWTGLLAGMVGFAMGASVMFIVRWRSIVAVATDRPPARTTLGWCLVVVAVLGAILGGLIVAAAIAPPSIGRSANRSTWPVTIIVAACAIPGLVTFLAIRWLAAEDHNWREDTRCRTQLLLRLRVELRRSLAALGALLTLLVVTAGTRRRVLIAYNPNLDEPVEGVLLYGLIFAVVLGIFYGAANGAIESRASSILDETAPLPDLAHDDAGTFIARRKQIESLLGVSSTWNSFESSVVIVAPLLTALIGTAIKT
jgi:MFS family permease